MKQPDDAIPTKGTDGVWRVGGKEFATEAQAWRWLDRQRHEPISRSEDTAQWVFEQQLRERWAD